MGKMTDDKRTTIDSTDITIDQKLIDEGTAQLNSEIAVLENWLAELDASKDNDTEIEAARKSYQDMLGSRREMLSALAKQAKLQAVVTK